MWLFFVDAPGIGVPIPRLAPRGGAEDLIGQPVARWPIQGKQLLSEIADAGGWLDVAEESVRALLPDVWPF